MEVRAVTRIAMHTTTQVDLQAAARAPGLLARLFAALHADDVRYCHWKGNEHVEAGWSGASDVDLLLDGRRRLELQGIFADCGFKRFDASEPARTPGVEDYLGFDADTGTLLHLHAHYRLVLGGDRAGPYFPQWEDAVLTSRCFDERHGLYVTDANLELLLLLLRVALEARGRRRSGRAMPARRLREHRWLLERTAPVQVEAWARRLLGEGAAAAVVPLMRANPSPDALRRFRRAAAPALRLQASHAAAGAAFRRALRRLARAVGAANRRWWRAPLALRRTDPAGGLVIAFLGADGSGKSTLVRELSTWLAWKLDVYRVYHGSGSGSASWLRWPLVAVLRLRNALTGRRSGTAAATAPPAGEAPAGRADGESAAARAAVGASPQGEAVPEARRRKRLPVARAAWALTLAWEKRGKLRRSWRARNRGLLVVTDRYPQDQVEGFNDGPLLSHWREHRNPLLRRLAAWERTPYRWARDLPPDLVIKLEVDPRVAFERKAQDGMELAEVARRVDAVASLRYAPERTVVVDVNRPLSEVLLQVKRSVWDRL